MCGMSMCVYIYLIFTIWDFTLVTLLFNGCWQKTLDSQMREKDSNLTSQQWYEHICIISLYLLSLTQVKLTAQVHASFLQWVLVTEQKDLRFWGIYHCYIGETSKLVSKKERALSSRFCCKWNPEKLLILDCEGLSFLAYSARIYSYALGPWWIDPLNSYLANFSKLIENSKISVSPRRK